MPWEFIIALLVAIPIILFPAAFVWYLNVAGIYSAVKESLARRAAINRKAEKEIAQAEVFQNKPWKNN